MDETVFYHSWGGNDYVCSIEDDGIMLSESESGNCKVPFEEIVATPYSHNHYSVHWLFLSLCCVFSVGFEIEKNDLGLWFFLLIGFGSYSIFRFVRSITKIMVYAKGSELIAFHNRDSSKADFVAFINRVFSAQDEYFVNKHREAIVRYGRRKHDTSYADNLLHLFQLRNCGEIDDERYNVLRSAMFSCGELVPRSGSDSG